MTEGSRGDSALTLLIGLGVLRDQGTDCREGDAGHGGHGRCGPHHPARTGQCQAVGRGSLSESSWGRNLRYPVSSGYVVLNLSSLLTDFVFNLESYSSLYRLGKSLLFILFHLFQNLFSLISLLSPLDVRSVKFERICFYKCHLSSPIPTFSVSEAGLAHCL